MKIKGFTLFELLICIALLTFLSCLSIASYSWLLRKNEQQSIVDELKSALYYAKIQAQTAGTTVFLMPLGDNKDWANGMVLKVKRVSTGELESIYQWQWYHPTWKLSWSGAHQNEIVFSNDTTNVMSNGHFLLENHHTHQKLVLVLNRIGRLRVSDNL